MQPDTAHAWAEQVISDETFVALVGDDALTVSEVALDYIHAGLWDEALELLALAPGDWPLSRYYAGWCLLLSGQEAEARQAFLAASALAPDRCFPNQLECVPALEAAQRLVPNDPRAPYYLGLFWYSRRRYEEAIACWEHAAALDPTFPTVQRNLGLAYVNMRGDLTAGLAAYQRAFSLDPTDARVFFELDRLRKRLNHPPEERLAALDSCLDLVEQRDDLCCERAALLNRLGRHTEALNLLLGRRFHPWEGGEGKVVGQYVLSLVQLAREALAREAYAEALQLLERARRYPPNLGEGKLPTTPENDILYEPGRAYTGLGDHGRAGACWEQAAKGAVEPVLALYYNDQPPELIFYRGLALRALGRNAEAAAIFEHLVAYGTEQIDAPVQIDYFAVSLPDFLVFDDDLQRRNRIHCHLMQALGYLGLGQVERAAQAFAAVLHLDCAHPCGVIHARHASHIRQF